MSGINNAIDATQAGVQTLSSGGIWSGSALTEYQVLIAGASNAISGATLTAGEVLIGTTSTAPSPATLTAGAGISITSASGAITIASSGEGISWNNKSTSFNAVAENGYFITAGATATLPTGAANGVTIIIVAVASSSVVVQCATGDYITIGTVSSSASGTATNTAAGNTFTLTYYATGTTWYARGVQGNWTLA